MKRVVIAACIAGALFSMAVEAQEALVAVPMQAGPVLPRNTPVYLTLNQTLNTKSKKTKKGNKFTLSVARNVLLDRHIVIPRGSRGVGTITYRTRKGGFGKSGKMEISLDYIEVGDTRIDIQGDQREEGEGNSTATVATFALVSMIGAGLITGHSAEIPAGTEFIAWTKDELPVQFPASGSTDP